MKKLLLSLVLTMITFSLSAQSNMDQVVEKLQKYLDGVEENATIVISDEGVITYTKRFEDTNNDYRAVFRLTNVDVSLEEVKAENYLEGEPKYYMRFTCEDKKDPCILYTKLQDESSTNSYKFSNFPVWTMENGKDVVEKLNLLKKQFE